MPLFGVTPVDRAYYAESILDFLPGRLIDIHTHVFEPDPVRGKGVRSVSWPSRVAARCSAADLAETARLMFPGKAYLPLMFGSPDEGADVAAGNAYVAAEAEKSGFPALCMTQPGMPPETVEAAVNAGGFRGIKVYLSFAPPYIPAEEIRIYDFLPRAHLEACDRRGWIVMLHIPRPLRLRDPVNLAQLLEIERDYKNLRLIVAHAGRAYCRSDVGEALDILSRTRNMVFDISANTNDWVFERLIRAVGPSRILFGSDLPITRMRMRRIERDGRYVNLVPRGLYGDVSGDTNMGELDPPESDGLSFFMYEEIAAFRRAALAAGLGRDDIERVFRRNAAEMLGLI